jgi:apolipoprotein D and lipocalin family protein
MDVLLLAVLMMGSVQALAPVQTVAAVDLGRYVGDWYEIARFPTWFQEKCASEVVASYAKRPDGRLDVVNRCRKADGSLSEARGVAKVVDTKTFSKLKVRFAPGVLSFLPFVWGNYWIIGLAEDYSWAVVGSPDRKYLWILARTPQLTGELYESALAAARTNGFDVGRLVPTRQISPLPPVSDVAR